MNSIVQRQRDFFDTHQTKDVSFRLNELNRLENLFKTHRDELDEAIATDFNKSYYESFITEMAMLFADIKEAKRDIHRWSRKRKVRTNIANFPAKSYLIPEPLGVCLVIGAWNYPYQLSFAPAIAALAAGNTVILKPSEIPSRTSKMIAKLVNENFDPRIFHVIEGGVPETTSLLKQKFDKIFFTGSTQVGKIIYKAAAEHLTPVTLELGGKSPVIVAADANLKMTAKRLVWAKFINAGQTCVAPDYVMVDEVAEEELLKHLVDEIKQADYAYESDHYVQIINQRNVERLANMLDRSKVHFGGEIDVDKRHIGPTVLTQVTFEDAIMQEEIFGPLLPVISYQNLDTAIAQIRKLPKPLSCYIFTSKNSTRRKALNELSFGGGCINDAVMHISNPNLPFGGVGMSGMGNYHGQAGFDCFTHYKSIMDKPTWLELPLKYAPYSKRKLAWLKKALQL